MSDIILAICIISISYIIGYTVARIFKPDITKDIEGIRQILLELKSYQHDHDTMYRFQQDNIRLERMNMRLCNELAKHVKEPEIIYIIEKARQESYKR